MKTEQIIDVVRDYLDDEGLKYDFNAERNVIRLGFNLKCRLKEVELFVKIKEDYYLVQAEVPLNGDPKDLGELLKYLAMANFGLIVGNFEIDVEDGQVRYKTYVPWSCCQSRSLKRAFSALAVCLTNTGTASPHWRWASRTPKRNIAKSIPKTKIKLVGSLVATECRFW